MWADLRGIVWGIDESWWRGKLYVELARLRNIFSADLLGISLETEVVFIVGGEEELFLPQDCPRLG